MGVRVKKNADGSVERLKACLVAKSFQQMVGVDFLETFSPVVKLVSVRLMFSLAATHKWDVQHIDVNNAFLNGTIDALVYMHQPEGFIDNHHPDYVCQLKRSLYGLRQAPRAWYEKLKHYLLKFGFIHSTSNHSLFYMRKNGKLLLILVYVDDILLIGDDPTLISKLIQNLATVFALKTLGTVTYFLGIQVTKTDSNAYILTNPNTYVSF